MKLQNPALNDFLQLLSAQQYLADLKKYGRRELPPKTRAAAAQLCQTVAPLLEFETSMSSAERNLLRFVYVVTKSESLLSLDPVPRYVSYVNLPILDRFLQSDMAVSLAEKWSSARRALAVTLESWRQFEDQRFAEYTAGSLPLTVEGYELTPKRKSGRTEHLRERIQSLYTLCEMSRVAPPPDIAVLETQIRSYRFDWQYFAESRDKQLAHFGCLPQSHWHDEVMFLKMIHATECCFAGILASLECLPSLVISKNWAGAAAVLKESHFFSDFLARVWEVFDTMPVPHFFDGFREATGNASAIQSVRFQKIENITRGLTELKRDHLRKHSETALVTQWSPPEYANLVELAQHARTQGAEADDLIDAIYVLDRDLLKWRSRHLGIARKYLPRVAVGTGDAGVAYLEATVRTPRLPDPPQSAASVDVPVIKKLPIRSTASFRIVRETMPKMLFLASLAKLNPLVWESKRRSYLKDLRELLRDRQQQPGIKAAQRLCQQFFPQNTYVVDRLIDEAASEAKPPTSLLSAAALLFHAHTALPLMILNATKISGTLSIDTASEDEAYQAINSRVAKCARGDAVLRDSKGIIASVNQGEGKRVGIDLKASVYPDKLLFVILAPPAIEWSRLAASLECMTRILDDYGVMISEQGTADAA